MRIYNIKETERRKQNMEKECSIGEMEVFIRESLWMVFKKVMESKERQMDKKSLKELERKEKDMEKGRFLIVQEWD